MKWQHTQHLQQLESYAGWLLANCTNWRWGILFGWCVVDLVFFGRSCFSLLFDFSSSFVLCMSLPFQLCCSSARFFFFSCSTSISNLPSSCSSLFPCFLFSSLLPPVFMHLAKSFCCYWLSLACSCVLFAFRDEHTQQSLKIIWNRPGPAMINLLERVVLRCCCVSCRSGSFGGGACCCWPYLFIFCFFFLMEAFLCLVVLISEDQEE